MQFKLIKVGSGEHEVSLSHGDGIVVNVVGVYCHRGFWWTSHASIKEVLELNKGKYPEAKFSDEPTGGFHLWINGCGYKSQSDDVSTATAWLAWYDNTPENKFFVNLELFETGHWELIPDTYGLFELMSRDIVLKDTCSVEATPQEITGIIINAY